eukprot:TRINITY_DN26012_c0_g1_i1.p1 TRINITY_DN26012_c0_g1~~TRINITY_DN26012_c0_g1_i1.p1  ORF type:complete len:253 (-),score=64.24 TRINITY_DN26012_c0_g1_i1:393-1151(-)
MAVIIDAASAKLIYAGLAPLNGICAIVWFASAFLDEKPFASESDLLGVVLGFTAICLAASFLALFTIDSSSGHSILLGTAALKVFYFFAVFYILLEKFMIKQKKVKKNWGYLVLAMLALASCCALLLVVLSALKSSGRESRSPAFTQEMMANNVPLRAGGLQPAQQQQPPMSYLPSSQGPYAPSSQGLYTPSSMPPGSGGGGGITVVNIHQTNIAAPISAGAGLPPPPPAPQPFSSGPSIMPYGGARPQRML